MSATLPIGRRVQALAACGAAALVYLCLALGATRAAAQTRGEPARLDPSHAYSLSELIDVAEASNPKTQVYWERAVQGARQLGLAESEYWPILVARATAGDERAISPFPKPLAPDGYTLVEVPFVAPAVELSYLVLDFGGRSGRVDRARAAKVAAAAQLVRENQEVAFKVAAAFYHLVTRGEALEAARQTLTTATVTEQAATARMENGRATAPDVLNAKAVTAQADFDLQSAIGDETIAHITLSETVGAEPSPNVQIVRPSETGLPGRVGDSIEALLDQAVHDRPDLRAAIANARADDAAARQARSAYYPTLSLAASAGRTWEWPTSSYGELGNASAWTWSVAIDVRWTLFDGGARKNRVEAAESKHREAQAELRDEHDRVVREVWTAYVSFLTARRKVDAALALLDAASSSYTASLDSYRLGVKSVIDVVTAEKQLATARLSGVSARAELYLEAVELELSTGNLLSGRAPLTRSSASGT